MNRPQITTFCGTVRGELMRGGDGLVAQSQNLGGLLKPDTTNLNWGLAYTINDGGVLQTHCAPQDMSVGPI
jgi:hypothetical protein